MVQLGDAPKVEEAQRWLIEHQVQVLNIAGPRESQCPGIGVQAAAYLRQLLSDSEPDL